MVKAKVEGNPRVTVTSNEKTIVVTDIEGDIDEDRLKEEIGRCCGCKDPSEIRVISMRHNRDGSQTAMVTAGIGITDPLVRQGYLQLGWTRSRDRLKVDPPRCFRCLGFGHSASACQGTDRRDCCMKCTKEGHRAKDCQGQPYCFECDIEGHRSDQMRCPSFRKLVDSEVKKRECKGK